MSAQTVQDGRGVELTTGEAGSGVLEKLTPRESVLPFACGRCEARWSGNLMAHCGLTGCHRTFGSVTGFDAHRTGPMGSRRCLTDAELGERGYEPNERGVWRQPRPVESLPG